MNTNFTLRNTDFSAEFANFVHFVGGIDLDEAIYRVAAKLKPLPASLRAFYEDRYFFHISCAAIADPPKAFQLDPFDPRAVRLASFIAGVNRMRASLSNCAVSRFRNVILGLLRPDRDIRQLEHEVRTFVHFGQKRVAVSLADLEQRGRFDMLCISNGSTFEVECKTITEDTGEQIKTDLLVALSETFRKTVREEGRSPGSGVYTLTFTRPPGQCRDLPAALGNALKFPTPRVFTKDFRLEFKRRDEWSSSSSADMVERHLQAIGRKYSAVNLGDRVLALALLPNKPSSLSQKIISTLKQAADQCSGTHPSLLWLHLIGHSEEEFLEVARFSQKGDGAGLNAIVANVVHPDASTTDRSHVYKIRFSAEPKKTTERSIIDRDRIIRKAKSLSGICYDVPNSFCRFTFDIDA